MSRKRRGRTGLMSQGPRPGSVWRAFTDEEQTGLQIASKEWAGGLNLSGTQTGRWSSSDDPILPPTIENFIRPEPRGIFTPRLVAAHFHAPERREIVKATTYEEALEIAQPDNPRKLDLRLRQGVYDRLGRMTPSDRALFLFFRDPRMMMREALILDNGMWSNQKSRANNFLGAMTGFEKLGSRERAAITEPAFQIINTFLTAEASDTLYAGGCDANCDAFQALLRCPSFTKPVNQFRSDASLGALLRWLLVGVGVMYLPEMRQSQVRQLGIRGPNVPQSVKMFAREFVGLAFPIPISVTSMAKFGRVQDELRALWIPRELASYVG